MDNNDTLYSVKDAARIMHCSNTFVYDLIKKGLLPALKLKSLRIRKESLDEFLEKYNGYDLSDINNVKPLSF